jgi:hypothetical protein
MRVITCALISILAMGLGAGTVFPARAPGAEQARNLQAVLDAPPPDPNATPKAELLKIYLERARAAGVLGDVDRQLREL